jgi:hypothetical protein
MLSSAVAVRVYRTTRVSPDCTLFPAQVISLTVFLDMTIPEAENWFDIPVLSIADRQGRIADVALEVFSS